MGSVVVVAGTTLPEAVWVMDALDLGGADPTIARAVSMGQVAIEGLKVSAVIVTPSLALAASGALGENKALSARRLIDSLHRSLAKVAPGARVRATTLHSHIKRDYALPEGFYHLPLTETAEPEFAPTHRTVETVYADGYMDAPASRKVVEHFEAPKPTIKPPLPDPAEVARHMVSQGAWPTVAELDHFRPLAGITNVVFTSTSHDEGDIAEVVARLNTMGRDGR